ncbi:hypothetical protein PMHK_08150 [Pseudomonas sp. MHK4]
MFGHVEHGHAAALGGGKIVHGQKPFYWIYKVERLALKPVSGDTKSKCAVKCRMLPESIYTDRWRSDQHTQPRRTQQQQAHTAVEALHRAG